MCKRRGERNETKAEGMQWKPLIVALLGKRSDRWCRLQWAGWWCVCASSAFACQEKLTVWLPEAVCAASFSGDKLQWIELLVGVARQRGVDDGVMG